MRPPELSRNAPVLTKFIPTLWTEGGGQICDSYKRVRRHLPRGQANDSLAQLIAAASPSRHGLQSPCHLGTSDVADLKTMGRLTFVKTHQTCPASANQVTQDALAEDENQEAQQHHQPPETNHRYRGWDHHEAPRQYINHDGAPNPHETFRYLARLPQGEESIPYLKRELDGGGAIPYTPPCGRNLAANHEMRTRHPPTVHAPLIPPRPFLPR